MKHMNRILGMLLAALLALGVFAPAAYAAPDSSTQILTVGGEDGVFEYFNGLEWKALVVPFWMAMTGNGSVAYCLESNKSQPWGDGYHMSSALYSANVLKGVRAILLYGYPNDLGGLGETDAWYVTQVAIWTFMYEAAGVGYESMAEHNMRPTAGNQAAYSFYQTLLDYARRGIDTVNYSARFNPHPVVLRPNGSGRLVGTTTIELENADSYSIDQTMLPAYTTIDGNTYRNGDTVTVTAPLADAGMTYTTYDIFHINSTRSPANIFWYEPDGGDLQKMVVYDMSFQPAMAIPLTITCEDAPQTGIIYLNKSNRDKSKGDYSLAGAIYRVFERNTGKSVADITTDANGNAQTGPLPLVDYLVWEVAAPYGFLLDDTHYTAYFTEAGAAQIYISAGDTPQQGKITVKKTNANTAMGDYSLAGAVFEIFSGSTLVDTITTDANGSAQSKALNLGNYTVKEKTAPNSYVLNTTSFPANLEYAGQDVQLVAASVTVPEQPQAGVIRVNKTNANSANGEYSLAGAVFEVRTTGGTLVDIITTDTQGKAQTKQLPLGAYVVTEKTAPAGFQRDTNEYTANLTYGGQDTAVVYADVNVPEQPQMGRINIKKTNATPALGDYPLNGAVFEIFDGSTLVDTLTTNAAGEAQSKALKLGTYTVKEKTAPYGFVLNTSSFTANLEYAGQDVELAVVSVTVPEEPQRGIIQINKTNADAVQGDYSLEGAVFEIRTEGGALVDTITTDANGKASSKELPLGAYVVTEKTAPHGFLRDKNEYDAVLTYAGQDTAVTTCTVNVPEKPQTEKINIKKTNAAPALGDYSLQGAVFEIYSGITLVDTVTTDAAGNAQSKALKLGNYTVKEKTAPHGFVLNTDSFPANLEYAGQDVEIAVVSVTVPEQPQRGVIRIAKANANPSMGDYSLQGAVFELHDSQGKLVDTITTNASGQANSKELPLGSYTVSEKIAPNGFVRNRNTFGAQLSYAGQDVTVVYADVAIAEQPQVGTITVTKKDASTVATAQGDAELTGAVFEVFASDKSTLVDTLYCGAGITATTKELPLGTYYVRERSAPVGYTLDEEVHQVKLVYAGQEIEVTGVSYDLKNKVIQGQIAIVKHLDTPMEGYDDPQIERPLEGAVFQVYLSAAGSYDAAKESERDLITTNENGFAVTKKLPYGLYTVAEIEAPGDVKMVDPFQVFISQEGKIYRFILNNITFRAQVKVVKVDAETGKPILLAGTTFKIRDLATGEFISQHVDYPTPADISEFETAPNGTLVLPEPLPSGEYELVEVVAPRGYLLSDTPVKFTVHSSNGQEMVTVTMENKPVMGKVKVEKTGDMLTGAKEIETIFGKQYLPIFEMGYLAGAEFDVVAAADIVTPDGTVRAKKGDVVDRLVTGEDGQALSKELCLGEYALVETKAPANYVLDTTPHPVSLVYEDQTVAVVTSQIGIMNARQLVEIELLKRMEGFDKFGHFEDVIFGLYTAQDIYAEDGKLIIAKDSLILTQDSLMALSALDDDGRGRFEGELPFAKYYVLELQTAEGFVLDSTKYPVDASYTGEESAVTRIKVNGGEAIVNKRALGELRVLKLDAHTHEPLQGAKFGLFQGDKKLGEAVTDAKGYALFSNLAFGEYQVKELEAPKGYVLVDEIYTINIRENGQKVLLEVLNQEQPGEPDEPDELEEPDEPEEPEIPDEPDVPEEPEEPTEPEQPTEPDEPEPDKPVSPSAGYPKTGDDSKLALWIGLLCIVAGGAAAALWMGKKKKKEELADETE